MKSIFRKLYILRIKLKLHVVFSPKKKSFNKNIITKYGASMCIIIVAEYAYYLLRESYCLN